MQASEEKRGFFRTIGRLYREGGFGRFYRGALPVALAYLPAHAAFFATYEFTRSKLHLNDQARAES